RPTRAAATGRSATRSATIARVSSSIPTAGRPRSRNWCCGRATQAADTGRRDARHSARVVPRCYGRHIDPRFGLHVSAMPRPARHPQRRPLALAVACFALGAPPAPAQIAPAAAPEESGEALLLEELARRGARIGRIDIEVQNVFDTSNPDEAKRLYR